MHELPILRDIVGVAVRHAAEAGADKVVAIDLQVGELRDLDPAWMQRYFNFVTAGTSAEGATLRIARSTATLWCSTCSNTTVLDLSSRTAAACSSCGSVTVELITGNELRIESIDVRQEP